MDEKLNALRAEHWKRVLHSYNLAWQETGITKAAWCMQNGIGIKSLYRWQRILRLEAADQLLPVRQDIVPVQVAPSPRTVFQSEPTSNKDVGEITVEKDGIIIRLPTSTPAEYLVTLARGMR